MEQPVILDGEDIQNEKHQLCEENDWIPQLGMEFETEEQAWHFWNRYARKMGFSARKSYAHKSRVDALVISRVLVCSNEGQRKEKKGDNPKNPRAETRTGCMASYLTQNSQTDDNTSYLTQNSQVNDYASYARLLTENSSFVLPSPHSEITSTSHLLL